MPGIYTLGGVRGASVTAEKVRAREKGVCVKEESIGRSRARHSASPSTSTKYGGDGRRRGHGEVLNGSGALITAARSLINGWSTCLLRLRRRTHRTITPAFDWNLCSVAQFRRPSCPCCPLILSQRCADGRRHTQWRIRGSALHHSRARGAHSPPRMAQSRERVIRERRSEDEDEFPRFGKVGLPCGNRGVGARYIY